GQRSTLRRSQCDTSARRHIFPAPRETIFDQIAQRLLGGKLRVFERSIPVASNYKRDVAELGISGLHRIDMRTQLAHRFFADRNIFPDIAKVALEMHGINQEQLARRDFVGGKRESPRWNERAIRFPFLGPCAQWSYTTGDSDFF